MEIYIKIYLPYLICCLTAVIMGVSRYRRLDSNLRLFIWYLAVVLIVEIYNFIQTIRVENNIWLYHFYVPFEYAFLVFIFSRWINNIKFRKYLKMSIIGFALLSIINGLVSGNLSSYNYFPVTISYPIYTGLSCYIIFQKLKEDRGGILKLPTFWIALGLLTISSCNIIYIAFHHTIINNGLIWPWVLHNIVNMAAYLIYAIGLYFGKSSDESEEEDISDAFPFLTPQQRKALWRTKRGAGK